MKILRFVVAFVAIVLWGLFMGYTVERQQLAEQIAEQRQKEAERQKHKFLGLTARKDEPKAAE